MKKFAMLFALLITFSLTVFAQDAYQPTNGASTPDTTSSSHAKHAKTHNSATDAAKTRSSTDATKSQTATDATKNQTANDNLTTHPTEDSMQNHRFNNATKTPAESTPASR